MMKRILLFCAALLLLLAGCGVEEPSLPEQSAGKEPGYVQAVSSDAPGSLPPMTLESLYDDSSVIAECVCVKSEPFPAYGCEDTFYTMRTETVFRGDVPENAEVPVRYPAASVFSPGDRCLLFGHPGTSVFSETDYIFCVYAVIEDGDGVISGWPTAEELSYEENRTRAAAYTAEQTYRGEKMTVGEYCGSDDLRRMYDFAHAVLEVVPREIVDDSLPDQTRYRCFVKDTLKGWSDETLDLVTFSGEMEPGQSYVVLLTWTDGIYTVCARRSVFPSDSPEAEQLRSF